MADGTNHGMGKKTNNSIRNNLSSAFNRSMTVNSSAAAAAAAAAAVAVNKPLYDLSNSPAFQRNGSVKSLHGLSFESKVSEETSLKGTVKRLCSMFESPKRNSLSPFNSQSSPEYPKPEKLLHTASDCSNVMSKIAYFSVPDSPIRLPGTKDRVVIYFTSLRGVRRTFEDCRSIRMILRGFRVHLDERDISMDVAYRKELQKVLGVNNVSLPQVFIKGRYIGGADTLKQLFESGELAKLLKGLPLRSIKPCDGCDDMRFMPCSNCSGSRKVFDEVEEQTHRCLECNENGLVRCPLCCS